MEIANPGRAKPSAGFTLFEVLIVAGLISVVMVSVLFFFQSSMASYRITSWKQERMREGEIFWKVLQKNVEEASNEHDSSSGVMVTTSLPLLFRPVPAGFSNEEKNGQLLKWRRSKMSAGGIIDYRLSGVLSFSNGNVLLKIESLEGPGPPEEVVSPAKVYLRDVHAVGISATAIRQSPARGDYLDDGQPTSDPVIGTVLGISVTFQAPDDVSKSLQTTQNHKFKLTVEAIQTTNQTFPEYED